MRRVKSHKHIQNKMSSNFTKFNKPPALPPKKIAPDPDYEVIEFSNEQYSNAQPIKAQRMCAFILFLFYFYSELKKIFYVFEI